jgi:hypothetical protein
MAGSMKILNPSFAHFVLFYGFLTVVIPCFLAFLAVSLAHRNTYVQLLGLIGYGLGICPLLVSASQFC